MTCMYAHCHSYTEKPGHQFALTADFAAAADDPASYDALLIPGETCGPVVLLLLARIKKLLY
jgi:putative intracellular protease/amidase